MTDHAARPITLADLRTDYRRAELREETVERDPILLFSRWFEEAVAAGVPEPNAMTLATATPAGEPAARTVLLKGLDARGFCFYTNHASQKGRELAANPRAALVFYWAELERQVRVGGAVTRLTAAETETYFRGRPLGSQIGAWASPQSEVVPDRATLEAWWAAAEARFRAAPVPVPPEWGGYRLAPAMIEFWQGRPNRLHDRLRFTRAADGGWRLERLAP
jgi:pyridoxamine 5'-phosphate oxidase